MVTPAHVSSAASAPPAQAHAAQVQQPPPQQRPPPQQQPPQQQQFPVTTSPPSHSIGVASWNCHSLLSLHKLDILLDLAQRRDLDIICLQETWHDARPDAEPLPILPSGWVSIFSPTDPYTIARGPKGRGLAIFARKEALRGLAPSLAPHLVHYEHTAALQLMIAQVGQAFVASAYVDCRARPRYAFEKLATALATACAERPGFPVILAGDFNHSASQATLWEVMETHLEARPLLPAATVTFPRYQSAIDNIFFRGEEEPLSAMVVDRAEVAGLSDHHLIVGRFSRTVFGATSPARPPAEARICWDRLRPPLLRRGAAPALVAQAKALHEARIQAITEAIRRAAPTVADLGALTTKLLDLAREHLGTRVPTTSPGAGSDFMWCPRVRAARAALQDARRAYHARRSAARKQRLNQADRTFKKLRRRAQTLFDLRRQRRLAQDLNPTKFYQAFKARRAPQGCSAGSMLDPAVAVPFWAAILTRDPAIPGPPIASWEPMASTAALELQPDLVKKAISLTQASGAAGPDGLAARFVKTFSATLQPLLHRLFLVALRQGLPPALKLGRTVLIPKTSRASRAPAKYRPITVLPVLTRILHKVVDLHLRELVYDLKIITACQAGFMPHRSVYDQAFIVSTLAAACPHLDPATVLILVLLDIEKAYDSILHEILLAVMASLHIPKEWCEVTRLLLLGTSTTILGVPVAITRGCPQGSPLSPLLCLFMMEDLHRWLTNAFPAGPPGFPLAGTATPQDILTRLWALLVHLIFADDNALLGTKMVVTQALLDAVAAWARHRHLRISPKSNALVLTAPPDSALRPTAEPPTSKKRQRDAVPPPPLPPPLTINGMALPWVASERYLGMRFAAQTPLAEARFDSVAPTASLPAVTTHRLHSLREVFSVRGATPLVHARYLVFGIKQVILAAALFPTAVLSVDYSRLDTAIFGFVRKAMALPCNAHSILLWHELHLWPTKFYGELRTLRYARSFKAHHWFYRELYQPLLETDAGPLLSHAGGALQRMETILRAYDMELATLDAAVSKEAWNLTVTASVATAMGNEFLLKFRSYPPTHQQHFRLVLELDATARPLPTALGSPPLYLKLGGAWAAIGLRAKAYSLRPLWTRANHDRPACFLCHRRYQECGAHLITCQRLPLALLDDRAAILVAIHHQATQTRPAPLPPGTKPRLPQRTAAERDAYATAVLYLQRLAWPHAKAHTVIAALKHFGRAINHYRAQVGTALAEGESNPIPFIRISL